MFFFVVASKFRVGALNKGSAGVTLTYKKLYLINKLMYTGIRLNSSIDLLPELLKNINRYAHYFDIILHPFNVSFNLFAIAPPKSIFKVDELENINE